MDVDPREPQPNLQNHEHHANPKNLEHLEHPPNAANPGAKRRRALEWIDKNIYPRTALLEAVLHFIAAH